MTRESLIALAAEFRRLGMEKHVEQLASYYRGTQGHRAPYAWSDAHVEGWLRRLRIPPYQDALPVLPQGTQCEGCAPAIYGRRTVAHFPGGAEFTCGGCGRVWLELEEVSAPEAGAPTDAASSRAGR